VPGFTEYFDLLLTKQKTRKPKIYRLLNDFVRVWSGERGIRTPGPVTVNGFQDRRIRPLCHLSAANIDSALIPTKFIFLFDKLFVT
jgi:hypothetical protein